MATSLTPQQQLSAANSQYRNWLNQQIAASGGYYPTIPDINAAKAAILNTGMYPDLDMGVTPPPAVAGGGLSVNIAPSQFFVVGQGGFNEDRVSGYNGQPIFSGGITDNTTIQQFNSAQAAYQSSLEQVYQTQGQDLSAQAQSAKEALAAAQARIKALEQQLAVDSPVETPPTSSETVSAARSAVNQQYGQEITPTDANPNANAPVTNLAEQYAQYRSSGTVIQNSTTPTVINDVDDNSVAQSSQQGSATNATINENTPQSTNTGNFSAEQAGAGRSGFSTVVTNNEPQAIQTNIEDKASSNTTTNNQNTAIVNNSGIVKSGTDSVSSAGGSSNNTTGTGTGTGSSASSNSTTGSGTTAPSNEHILNNPTVRGNKLHDYVNHTYKFTIYAIPKETINLMYDGVIRPGNEQAILNSAYFVLSDGGRGATNADKSYFPTDLGLDNVELETIVATNYKTRGSDVIMMKFDIIEPYTVNFLARLGEVSKKVNPLGSWDTTFFVMVIEFLGYDELGRPKKIPNTTKYIPFTFLSMTFKISASGGVYSCQAVPTSLIANTVLDNIIPFHVETQAKTVGELFDAQEIKSYDTVKSYSTVNEEKQTTRTVQDGALTETSTVTKGLGKALNQNEVDKCKPENKGQTLPNVYEFKFDTSIFNATIGDPNNLTENAVAMPDAKKDKDSKIKGQVGALTAEFDKKTFRAQAGTKITDFINSVVTISSYMTDQNTPSGHDSQTVNLWKINPQIKFGSIDPATNYYQRTVRYNIVPYTIKGMDAPGFGQKQVDKSDIVKLYQYIYSGANQDILDVSIDYKVAFFEVRNGVPTRYTGVGSEAIGQNDTKDPNDYYKGNTDSRFFKPRYFHSTGHANRQNTAATTTNEKLINVTNLMEKLMDNQGDMISLDITIVGDPDWISQDVPLYGPILPSGSYIGDGSVNFTNPVYFNFYFATPQTDYDDDTGIFNKNGIASEFSGIYQVVSVKSNFQNGKFTQKLTNFRVRNQETKTNTASRNDSVNGFDAATAASNLSKPTAERATQTVVVTDPRAGLPKPNNIVRRQAVNSAIAGVYNDRTGLLISPQDLANSKPSGIAEDFGSE